MLRALDDASVIKRPRHCLWRLRPTTSPTPADIDGVLQAVRPAVAADAQQVAVNFHGHNYRCRGLSARVPVGLRV